MSALLTNGTSVIDRPSESTPNQGIANLLERGVLLSVRTSVFGNSRKLASSQVETQADQRMVNVQKKLLDAPELEQISRFDRETREYVYNRSLPFPLKGGIYLQPIATVGETEAYLQARSVGREALIDQFLAVYQERLEEAAGLLRGTFNRYDYPSTEEMRGRFSFSWQYLSLTTPANLPPSLFQQEQEKVQAQWAEAFEEARQVLRAALAGMVEHALDRLRGGDDGKPKVFTKTMIPKLNEFLETFSARNLTDDAQLAAVVQQARALVQGIDTDTLKKDAKVRERVAQGMDEIKASLDTMMSDKPKRSFFDD